jgi:hypothetical protein
VLELLFIVGLSKSRRFRVTVDHEISEAESRENERQREQWMAMMSDRHQQELKALAVLVRSIRDRADGYRSAHLVLDRHLDLDGMLTAYAQLAIRHYEAERCLLLTCGDIDRQAAEIDENTALGRTRRSILERRKNLREQVRKRLEEIEAQLSAIANAVRLAHEHGLLVDHERDSVRERLDDFLERLSSLSESLEELSEPAKPAKPARPHALQASTVAA